MLWLLSLWLWVFQQVLLLKRHEISHSRHEPFGMNPLAAPIVTSSALIEGAFNIPYLTWTLWLPPVWLRVFNIKCSYWRSLPGQLSCRFYGNFCCSASAWIWLGNNYVPQQRESIQQNTKNAPWNNLTCESIRNIFLAVWNSDFQYFDLCPLWRQISRLSVLVRTSLRAFLKSPGNELSAGTFIFAVGLHFHAEILNWKKLPFWLISYQKHWTSN